MNFPITNARSHPLQSDDPYDIIFDALAVASEEGYGDYTQLSDDELMSTRNFVGNSGNDYVSVKDIVRKLEVLTGLIKSDANSNKATQFLKDKYEYLSKTMAIIKQKILDKELYNVRCFYLNTIVDKIHNQYPSAWSAAFDHGNCKHYNKDGKLIDAPDCITK